MSVAARLDGGGIGAAVALGLLVAVVLAALYALLFRDGIYGQAGESRFGLWLGRGHVARRPRDGPEQTQPGGGEAESAEAEKDHPAARNTS